jgi:hypothetical protein
VTSAVSRTLRPSVAHGVEVDRIGPKVPETDIAVAPGWHRSLPLCRRVHWATRTRTRHRVPTHSVRTRACRFLSGSHLGGTGREAARYQPSETWELWIGVEHPCSHDDEWPRSASGKSALAGCGKTHEDHQCARRVGNHLGTDSRPSSPRSGWRLSETVDRVRPRPLVAAIQRETGVLPCDGLSCGARLLGAARPGAARDVSRRWIRAAGATSVGTPAALDGLPVHLI